MSEYFDENGDDNMLVSSLAILIDPTPSMASLYKELSLGLQIIDRLNRIFNTTIFFMSMLMLRCIQDH